MLNWDLCFVFSSYSYSTERNLISETERLYTQVLLESQKSLAWQYVAPHHFLLNYIDKNTLYQRDD